MDEDKLDERGHEPLMIVINNIRRIFRGKEDGEDLTAALAYMHSQGEVQMSYTSALLLKCFQDLERCSLLTSRVMWVLILIIWCYGSPSQPSDFLPK